MNDAVELRNSPTTEEEKFDTDDEDFLLRRTARRHLNAQTPPIGSTDDE